MLVTPPTVLITDDDLGFRETLRSVLEPEGLQTVLASDGEEALDIIRRQEVHLLLSDMNMPKLTGLETIRRVKAMKAVLPCILLSANADAKLVRQARRVQTFSVIPKPVSRRQITTIVNLALLGAYNWPLLLRRT